MCFGIKSSCRLCNDRNGESCAARVLEIIVGLYVRKVLIALDVLINVFISCGCMIHGSRSIIFKHNRTHTHLHRSLFGDDSKKHIHKHKQTLFIGENISIPTAPHLAIYERIILSKRRRSQARAQLE